MIHAQPHWCSSSSIVFLAKEKCKTWSALLFIRTLILAISKASLNFTVLILSRTYWKCIKAPESCLSGEQLRALAVQRQGVSVDAQEIIRGLIKLSLQNQISHYQSLTLLWRSWGSAARCGRLMCSILISSRQSSAGVKANPDEVHVQLWSLPHVLRSMLSLASCIRLIGAYWGYQAKFAGLR